MDPIDRLLTFMPSQPWWVYALIVLMPLFFILALREFTCWFWKINRLADSLERLEATSRELKDVMERAVQKRASGQPNQQGASGTFPAQKAARPETEPTQAKAE